MKQSKSAKIKIREKEDYKEITAQQTRALSDWITKTESKGSVHSGSKG